MSHNLPRVTVVVPAYNEALAIEPFLKALLGALDGMAGCACDVLVVNDGSTDGTAGIVRRMAAADSRIRMISFGRNAGHQKALVAGLDHVDAAAVVMMDGDGQHPPAVARQMVEQWMADPRQHIVQAIRRGSQGAGKDWTSRYFYWMMKRLCPELSIVSGMSDFRLLDRSAVALVRRYPDRHRNLRMLVASLPMPIVFVEYEVAPRLGGRSKFTLRKMIHLAADGLFAYSNVPLRLSMCASAVTGSASLVFFIYATVMKWQGATAWGWASLVCLITGLFAAMFGVLAIISEYVARIYEDVRGTPVYWVDPDGGSGASPTGGERMT